MKQVLTDIVKSIVDNPDEVVVLEKVSGDMSILELSVAKEDMGKVIGRQGRELNLFVSDIISNIFSKLFVSIIKLPWKIKFLSCSDSNANVTSNWRSNSLEMIDMGTSSQKTLQLIHCSA